MNSSSQAAGDVTGVRSGGKIMKERRISARNTPYERPTPPPQPENPNWFNGLVYPAKFVADGASKLLSSFLNSKSWGSHSCSSDSDSDSEGVIEDDHEDNENLFDGGVNMNQNKGSSSGKSEILYLVEQLLMLERYSREECDGLIEIINSRVIDHTMREGVDVGPKNPDTRNQIIKEARTLITKNMVGSSSKSDLVNDTPHGSKSLMANKDYVAAGSWNLEDEIRHLRSKVTETRKPEDKSVNLASEGGARGFSDTRTNHDDLNTEALSSLPTIEEQIQMTEEQDAAFNNSEQNQRQSVDVIISENEKNVQDDTNLVTESTKVSDQNKPIGFIDGSQDSSISNSRRKAVKRASTRSTRNRRGGIRGRGIK